jgi:uncharacterized protein
VSAFVLACTLYLVQAVLSLIWLRYYAFGPLEWLWRVLMYGHLQVTKNLVQSQLRR